MLTAAQLEALAKPLPLARVAKRKGGSGKELSYLEAWDVKAHLIRIFGYGGWSFEVTDSALVYEEQGEKYWTIAYKVTGRLMIHDVACTYTECAVGEARGPRGEAHDNAVKTAASDALKRCAINLGTQYGLSLYDNGNRNDVVGTVVGGPEPDVTGIVQAIQIVDSLDALREIWNAAKSGGLLEVIVDGLPLGELFAEKAGELQGAEVE